MVIRPFAIIASGTKSLGFTVIAGSGIDWRATFCFPNGIANITAFHFYLLQTRICD